MKLTFFNKDNLDPVDIEQATITTTDANSDNITAIRNTNLSDTYKSALSNQTIKEITIPFEYLEFYTDGNESKGGFSKTSLTSGDPQVIKEGLTLGRDGTIVASFTEQVDKSIPVRLAGVDCVLDRVNSSQAFPTLRELGTNGVFELPLTQFETYLEVEISGTVIPILSNLLDRSFLATPLVSVINTSERGLNILKDYLLKGVGRFIGGFLSNQGAFHYSQITSSNYTRLDGLLTQASQVDIPNRISETYTKTLTQDTRTITNRTTSDFVLNPYANFFSGYLGFVTLTVPRLSFDIPFTRAATRVSTLSKSNLQMKDNNGFSYFTKRALSLKNITVVADTVNPYTRFIDSFNSDLTFANSFTFTTTHARIGTHPLLGTASYITTVIGHFNWDRVHSRFSGTGVIAQDESYDIPINASSSTISQAQATEAENLRFSIEHSINLSGFFESFAGGPPLYIDFAIQAILPIKNQIDNETQTLSDFVSIPRLPSQEDVPVGFTNLPVNTEIRVNKSTLRAQGLSTPNVFRFNELINSLITTDTERIDYGYVDVSTGVAFKFEDLPLLAEAGTERDFATINRILANDPITFNFNSHDYSITEFTNIAAFPAGQGTVLTGNDPPATVLDPGFLLEIVNIISNIRGRFGSYLVNHRRGNVLRLTGGGGAIGPGGLVENTGYPANFNENFYSNRSFTFNAIKIANIDDFTTFQRALRFPREELTIQVSRAGGANFYDRPKPADVLEQERIAREDYEMCLRDYARELAIRNATPVSLISGNPEFPFVSVNDIRFRHSNSKLLLYMSRQSRNAPTPSPLFFDNIIVDNQQFDFVDATYSAIEHNTNPVDINSNPFPSVDVSKYEWDAPEGDPTHALSVFNVIFNKTKGYKAGRIVVPRKVITKSTIETINKKTIAPIINGFKVSDFDFTSTSFSISFNQNINTNDFNCIRIYDKDGLVLLSRDLRYGDAVKTSVGSITTFVWSDHPEFEILRNNKIYQIGIVTNASQTEGRYFVPRPAIADSDYPVSIIQDGRNLEFTLQSNRASGLAVRPFNAVYVNRENNTRVGKVFNISDAIRNDNHFLLNNWKLQSTLPAFNTKYNLIFSVENFTNLDISFLKMTDFFFDTLVILNTNIEDISLKNSAGVELIHPSDIDSFKYVIEDNKRHIVLFLKNPISSQEIILRTNQTFKDEKQRLIGKVFLLRKIGCFSQYPFVRPMISSNRQSDKSLFNKTHVKSQIDSMDYNIEFPVLEKESDMLLAQDLFSRKSGYNEFVAWMSGGDLPEKITAVKGFRFQDLIKGLCVNEFEYEYQDGRFSSGGIFNMDIVEVI